MGVRLTQNQFIEEANKIHSNHYDYSKVKYINNKTKVIIGCPIHGDFLQSPRNHIHKGAGCLDCSKNNGGRRLTTKQFIDKVSKIHNNRYDYSKVNYINYITKVTIICPLHGEFQQTPNEHRNGCGCPICRLSKGELKVASFLIANNINFTPQYTFDDCRGKRSVCRFDFYLHDYNVLIEYDGEQHFFGWDRDLESLKLIQENDAIKNKYCADNCIRLLRISYKEISLIDEKIKQFLI